MVAPTFTSLLKPLWADPLLRAPGPPTRNSHTPPFNILYKSTYVYHLYIIYLCGNNMHHLQRVSYIVHTRKKDPTAELVVARVVAIC